jgi:hypothetical protein
LLPARAGKRPEKGSHLFSHSLAYHGVEGAFCGWLSADIVGWCHGLQHGGRSRRGGLALGGGQGPLNADQFMGLAEGLIGTPVKDVTDTDRAILEQLLADDARTIAHSQRNELLFLVNKDRMERAFFDYFFGAGCTVGTLSSSVLAFQKVAMLCFGNFIYAYRTLPRPGDRAAGP